MMKQPTKFLVDNGETFDVEVRKTNKKTIWIKLTNPKTKEYVRTIKVKKTNYRLSY